MPNKDQTGPMGAGPMTGRGMGSCNGGFGRGRGCGMGMGRRGYNALAGSEKKTILESEAQCLKDDLNRLIGKIESRIQKQFCHCEKRSDEAIPA